MGLPKALAKADASIRSMTRNCASRAGSFTSSASKPQITSGGQIRMDRLLQQGNSYTTDRDDGEELSSAGSIRRGCAGLRRAGRVTANPMVFSTLRCAVDKTARQDTA